MRTTLTKEPYFIFPRASQSVQKKICGYPPLSGKPRRKVMSRRLSFLTLREAQLWIADGDHRSTAGTTIDDWDVTERPRVRRRCEGNYCGVAEICTQFEIYRRENENRTEGK